MNDQAIETEIKAKGLSAPRVTLDQLNANIVSVEIVKHIAPSGQVLRWAVLTTRNGYAVTGRPSVSVSPENDNAELGEQIARDNARNELWPLMGYALKERLAYEAQWVCGSCSTQFSCMPKTCPHGAPGCDGLLATGR